MKKMIKKKQNKKYILGEMYRNKNTRKTKFMKFRRIERRKTRITWKYNGIEIEE